MSDTLISLATWSKARESDYPEEPSPIDAELCETRRDERAKDKKTKVKMYHLAKARGGYIAL